MRRLVFVVRRYAPVLLLSVLIVITVSCRRVGPILDDSGRIIIDMRWAAVDEVDNVIVVRESYDSRSAERYEVQFGTQNEIFSLKLESGKSYDLTILGRVGNVLRFAERIEGILLNPQQDLCVERDATEIVVSAKRIVGAYGEGTKRFFDPRGWPVDWEQRHFEFVFNGGCIGSLIEEDAPKRTWFHIGYHLNVWGGNTYFLSSWNGWSDWNNPEPYDTQLGASGGGTPETVRLFSYVSFPVDYSVNQEECDYRKSKLIILIPFEWCSIDIILHDEIILSELFTM